MTTAEISPTMRDYLAEIYRLSDRATQAGYVSTSELADLLEVSAPAVNRMVTKLKELDLLIHEPYQGISLTETGRRQALTALRRHRIAEAFLVNVMGFAWHEIHEEASRISTTLSDMLTQRMAEMAGDPQTCPHGEPIPALDGTFVEPNDILLSDAPQNIPLTVTRVRTRESDRLQYLAALGLMPGAPLTMIHAAPFNGPLQLKLKDEYRII
ncbi:MAG: metal-dependent transcriptional regulator, partial [Chitinophagaceae bacterium]|nr:metal-dependent transcriptional regulator [Anaerolineae bacterium]